MLYVRNLTLSVSEETIREVFERFGKVDRVKKIKDYAFVHFDDRERAAEAMAALNHHDLNGSPLEISLAKPPSDKKKKEEMLRKREQRMFRNMPHRYNCLRNFSHIFLQLRQRHLSCFDSSTFKFLLAWPFHHFLHTLPHMPLHY